MIGGGPAGAAAALALRDQGRAVAVIERSNYEHTRVGETLPPAVRPLLISLGVWDHFLAAKHSPSFGIRSAWGEDYVHDNDFIFNPYGTGWHVERKRFDSLLMRYAEAAGASVHRSARMLSCSKDSLAGHQIEIACHGHLHTLRAKFVVDATGRASSFACKQGARRISFDHLVGVIAFLSWSSSVRAPDSFTLLETVEEGWWYSAILPHSRLVVAYMTDADLFGKASKLSANYWHAQLQRTIHTRARAEGFAIASRPLVVAANSSKLDSISGLNWLAVGDAASAFDPLSGQGVCKALDSGLRAARAIDDYFTNDKTALEKYTLAVQEQFEVYLRMRDSFYSKETRWSNSNFWLRRNPSPSR